MLHTGSNFGCSAPQTDGGPDNVAWVTHGVHVMLVREGVFNQIDWIRLKPGHSHNPQDQTFATVKCKFVPFAGGGVGCRTPWEMEARL
eukprot:3605250-Pleurochrysis_carterae.AAC.1